MGCPGIVEVIILQPHQGIILFVFIIYQLFDIVISEYKKEGFVEAGNDKPQIIHGKIPGAKDHVNILEPFFNGIGIYQWIYLIGYT
jgi:hypothetical protein